MFCFKGFVGAACNECNSAVTCNKNGNCSILANSSLTCSCFSGYNGQWCDVSALDLLHILLMLKYVGNKYFNFCDTGTCNCCLFDQCYDISYA